MRKLFAFGAAIALASSAFAAPNVTQVTQKGSLHIWPDIRVDGDWNTLVRLQNDGNQDVDVKCYWMDGNKNRVDFLIPVTRNQAVWFDARSGNGAINVNPFPQGPANGLRGTEYPYGNPYLPNVAGAAVPAQTQYPAGLNVGDKLDPEQNATSSGAWNSNSIYVDPAYRKGLLACWAVDNSGQNQVKWNHLSGTATVYSATEGAYEYNAYAFFVPTGLDKEPVGVAGALQLNSVQYDSCPLYQIGQFSPVGADSQPATPAIFQNRLAVAGCNLFLQQDWSPYWTKLKMDVWNEDEILFTGAHECSDSWHEITFEQTVDGGPLTVWDGKYGSAKAHQPYNNAIDAGAQSFLYSTLKTYAARYRIQGVKDDNVCEGSLATGIVAVQSTQIAPPPVLPATTATPQDWVGTTLAAAGKASGQIVWDPSGAVPEGAVR